MTNADLLSIRNALNELAQQPVPGPLAVELARALRPVREAAAPLGEHLKSLQRRIEAKDMSEEAADRDWAATLQAETETKLPRVPRRILDHASISAEAYLVLEDVLAGGGLPGGEGSPQTVDDSRPNQNAS